MQLFQTGDRHGCRILSIWVGSWAYVRPQRVCMQCTHKYIHKYVHIYVDIFVHRNQNVDKYDGLWMDLSCKSRCQCAQ